MVFSILSDVAVVISDHLDEESLGLGRAALFQDIVVDDVNDLLAISIKLCLNLLLVVGKNTRKLGILWVCLNGSNCAASRTL